MTIASNTPFILERQSGCPVCDGPGEARFSGLTDRLFAVPGSWDMQRCVDPACGCSWIDPRPDRATVRHAYASYYTHGDPDDRPLLRRFVSAVQRCYIARRYGYTDGSLSFVQWLVSFLPALHPGVKHHMDTQVMHLPRMVGGRLLDLGCGDGWITGQLVRLGWRADGVEPDSRSAVRANARGVRVINTTLEETDVESGAYDAVISCHVIEHLHDPAALLRLAHSALKPSGQLVIATPNPHGRMARRFGRDWFWLDPPRHLVLLTPSALRQLAEGAGFRDIRITTTVRDANVLDYASREIRSTGHFAYGSLPGVMSRLRGQWNQYITAIARQLGAAEGDELVLMARR